MSKPRVFLVGDTSNRTNWGCRATSLALKSMIARHGRIEGSLDIRATQAGIRKRFSNRAGFALERTLVGRCKEGDEGWKLHAERFFSGAVQFLGVTIGSLERLSDELAAGRILPTIADRIRGADVVLINGEGSFMGRRVSGRVEMLVGYCAATRFGKPVALVNHTADLRDPVMAALGKKVYPVFQDVCVREHFSLRLVEEFLPRGKARLCPDAVFSLVPDSGEEWVRSVSRPNYYGIYPDSMAAFDPSRPYLCVGGSSLYAAKKRPGFPFEAAYEQLVRALAELAPVVVTASSHPDDFFLQPLARRLGLPYLGLSVPTYQALDVLANASVYVGGRWHPKIMALTGGTPVVAFSANSDFKSRGILELAGLEQESIPAYEIRENCGTLKAIAARYIEQGETLRAALRTRVSELGARALSNVELLKSLAESSTGES